MAWVKCGIRVLGILDRNNNQLLVLKSILPGELVPLFSYVNLPLPVPCPLDQVPVLQLSCPVAQLCLTVCDPTDCNLPGSSVHGILQARIVKWVAMPSSRGSSRPRDQTQVSYISCIGRWVLSH